MQGHVHITMSLDSPHGVYNSHSHARMHARTQTHTHTLRSAEPGSPQRLVREMASGEEEQSHLGHAHHTPRPSWHSFPTNNRLGRHLLASQQLTRTPVVALGAFEVRGAVRKATPVPGKVAPIQYMQPESEW